MSTDTAPTVTVTIDGQPYQMTQGENLLQAVLKQGLELPYFCWHPSLEVAGSCRQCAMMVYQDSEDTRGRMMMACTLTARDGMFLSLKDRQASSFRQGVAELLMSNHPLDCPVCEEAGECHLQDMTILNGQVNRRYHGKKRTHHNQYLGPFINHEMNRCIACYRCDRFYRDYAGGDDLTVFSSRNKVYFGRIEDGTLESNFSGNLVEMCPTGVFTDKSFSQEYNRKWDLRYAPSICSHCSVGCNTTPSERHGRIRRVQNRYHSEINGHFLCDLGRYAGHFNNSEQRLDNAAIRHHQAQPQSQAQPQNQAQPQSPAQSDSLDQHNRKCSTIFAPLDQQQGILKLQQWLDQYQGQIVGIGSPRADVETNFALQDLVGPHHFHPGFDDQQLVLMDTVLQLNSEFGPAISARDLEQSDCVLIVGEDIGNSAPRLVLAARQSAKRGKVYHTHVGTTEVDQFATGRFHGTTAEQLVVINHLVEHLVTDRNTAAELPIGWSELALELVTAARPVIVSGTSHHSVELLSALSPLMKIINQQRHKQALSPARLLLATQECNDTGLALLAGKNIQPLATFIDAHQPKLLLIVENDLARRFTSNRLSRLRQQVDTWVVLDNHQTPTSELADLVLATTTVSESNGTLINYEGRLQRHIAVHDVSHKRLPAWQWLNAASLPASCCPDNSELARQLSLKFPDWHAISTLWPEQHPGFRQPRQPHRYSGRCAETANISVHEVRPSAIEEDPYSFSMETASIGERIPATDITDDAPLTMSNHGPQNLVFNWQPGWNSLQSQFHQEQQNRDAFLHFASREPLLAKQPEKRSPPVTDTAQITLLSLPQIYRSDELAGLSPPIAERAPEHLWVLSPALAEQLELGDDQQSPPDQFLQIQWGAQQLRGGWYIDAQFSANTLGIVKDGASLTVLSLPVQIPPDAIHRVTDHSREQASAQGTIRHSDSDQTTGADHD